MFRLLVGRPRGTPEDPIAGGLGPADQLELALLLADEATWASYETAVVDPEEEGKDDPLIRQWGEEIFGDG